MIKYYADQICFMTYVSDGKTFRFVFLILFQLILKQLNSPFIYYSRSNQDIRFLFYSHCSTVPD